MKRNGHIAQERRLRGGESRSRILNLSLNLFKLTPPSFSVGGVLVNDVNTVVQKYLFCHR